MSVESFEADIKRNEGIVQGAELFLHCVDLYYSGQASVVKTYRAQFRNLIKHGKEKIRQAHTLLEAVNANETDASELENFNFAMFHEHPEPEQMVYRAEVITVAYQRLFPGRDTKQNLNEEEIIKLMDTAVGLFQG